MPRPRCRSVRPRHSSALIWRDHGVPGGSHATASSPWCAGNVTQGHSFADEGKVEIARRSVGVEVVVGRAQGDGRVYLQEALAGRVGLLHPAVFHSLDECLGRGEGRDEPGIHREFFPAAGPLLVGRLREAGHLTGELERERGFTLRLVRHPVIPVAGQQPVGAAHIEVVTRLGEEVDAADGAAIARDHAAGDGRPFDQGQQGRVQTVDERGELRVQRFLSENLLAPSQKWSMHAMLGRG